MMRAWIGVALIAAAWSFSAPAASAGAGTVPRVKAQEISQATDFSARRVHRRYPAYPAYARYPSYPAYPRYYARPSCYRPYPYTVPAPFYLGFGYLPHH